MMKKTKEKEDVAPQEDIASPGQPIGEAPDATDTETIVDETGDSGAPAEDAMTPVPEDTVESLRDKVASLEDNILRGKADFLNTQRRQEKSRQDAVRYANADLMRSLLGVLDDFDRSLEAAQKAENTQAVVEGVQLVYENLKKELTSQGLEAIDATGQPFDPHVHEAILMQPTAECEPNTVMEQIAMGFRLHDRVLRPAKVIVSKAVEENTVESGDKAEGNGEGPNIDVDA